MQAARELIAEKGSAGFTFAMPARSAGVSAAAPYGTSADREALLAECGARRVSALRAMLSTAGRRQARCPHRLQQCRQSLICLCRAEPA